MKKFGFILFWILLTLICPAQGVNMVYEKFDPTPNGKALHCDIDILPDGERCVISSAGWSELIVADVETMQAISTYKVGKWNAGSRIEISPNGEYALLKQHFYIDFAPNKDREVEFEVVNVSTGEVKLKINAAHDAGFHPDSERLIVLEGDEVYAYTIDGSEKKTLCPVPAATNCAAISHDGKMIAISHHPEDEYLENYVTKKRQKKNFKLYQKYRQCVSVYDAETYEKLYTVDEMFDIPYILEFGPRNEFLICYSVPHTKVVAKTGMQGTRYISKINSADGKTTSVGFVSNAVYEPDFEFSHNGDFIALVTINANRHPEVWVANYNTGDIVGRYELAQRTFGGHMKGEFVPDAGRVGVAFTADDSHLLFTYGSLLVKWKIPYKS